MAKSPQRVWDFLRDLYKELLPYAKKERQALQAFAETQGHVGPIKDWDLDYYTRLHRASLAFDMTALRPYLKVGNALEALFFISKRLYNLDFKLNTGAYSVWDERVLVYEVWRNKSVVGLLYVDLFSSPHEEEEHGGRWEHNFVKQGLRGKGDMQVPHSVIAIDLVPQKNVEPQDHLFSWRSVQSLFHEFGHALDTLLSKGRYRKLTGPIGPLSNAASYRDLVELPSQLTEEWLHEPIITNMLLSSHDKNNTPLPKAWVQKIVKYKNQLNPLRGPTDTLIRVRHAMLDMAWHDGRALPKSWGGKNFSKFESAFLGELPRARGMNMLERYGAMGFDSLRGFANLSAAWYIYLWSEMLVANVWREFVEHGVLSRKMGKKFEECISSQGKGADVDMLLRNFCNGQHPTPHVLIKHRGLTNLER